VGVPWKKDTLRNKNLYLFRGKGEIFSLKGLRICCKSRDKTNLRRNGRCSKEMLF